MWSFLLNIWYWIVWAFEALLPFKRGFGIPPFVKWLIWIVLDLSFLIAIYFADKWWFRFFEGVRMPRFLTALNLPTDIWAPILGQLLIFTFLALYWFYLLWFGDEDTSPFPDIDEAWNEALQALNHAGIQVPKVPLFVVLGRPESSEENLFDGSNIKLNVKQTPTNPRAPVHVFASHEGIYVTCRGASVLGKLAGVLALEDLPEGTPQQDGEAEADLDATQRPGRKEHNIIELLRGPSGHEAGPIRRRAIRRAVIGKPLGTDLMSNAKEVALLKARLAHLCSLIMRDRQPYCGANGILLLVPLAGTDSPAEAQLTAQAAQEDLGVLRHEMKLDCPVISVLVDMESLPGFVDLIGRQPPKELGNRRGNGFPMATRLTRDEMLEQIHTSLHWVCTTYLQDSVYRIFQTESQTNKIPSALFPGNARLVLLIDEMNERADSLRRIIHEAVTPDNDDLFRYAGCYLAATGPKGTQAFVAGVFQKLVREQSAVTWTTAALADDADCHSWANYYFIISCVLVLVLALLIASLFFFRT